MKKILAVLLLAMAIIGCAGSDKGVDLGNLDESGVIDRETDIPFITYTFLKIKPKAAEPLGKFCEAVKLAEDKGAIVALINDQLADYKGALLADEYTRKWLLAKAERLVGVTIDPEAMLVDKLDENATVARLKEDIALLCEGVEAYQDSL